MRVASLVAQAGLLAFNRTHPETASDIWVVPIAPDGSLAGESEAVFASTFNEFDPAFSADGTLLAFTSDESGEPQIYVARYPGTGAKKLVSRDGGRFSLWRGDTDELLYWSQQGLHSVRVTGTSELDVGEHRLILVSEPLTP